MSTKDTSYVLSIVVNIRILQETKSRSTKQVNMPWKMKLQTILVFQWGASKGIKRKLDYDHWSETLDISIFSSIGLIKKGVNAFLKPWKVKRYNAQTTNLINKVLVKHDGQDSKPQKFIQAAKKWRIFLA